jgi:hypothetical protein
MHSARDGGPGDELDDWLRTEAELKAEGETTEKAIPGVESFRQRKESDQ